MSLKMRSPHPNEMGDDFKVVGHVSELMQQTGFLAV